MENEEYSQNSSRKIYMSDNICIKSNTFDKNQPVFITFDHHSIGEGFEREGFAERYFIEKGISAIHVLGRGNDWYQYHEIFDALKTICAATANASRIITYGSSMGGYAAIRFADAVMANAVLALSPQWTVDPKLVPWENRWLQDAHRIRWLESLRGPVRCGIRPIVVYDPHLTLDRRHAEHIAADTPSTLVSAPYGGHPVTTFLGEVGILQEMIADLLHDRFDPAAITQAIRSRRASSSIYLGGLAERQPATRPRTAIALARTAKLVRPDSPLAMLSLARTLTKTDNHEEAIALHREIALATGRMPIYLTHFAEALWQANSKEEAVTIAQEVVATLPDVSHLRNWHADMLWKYGDLGRAVAEQKMAFKLDPMNRIFIIKFLIYKVLYIIRWSSISKYIISK